METMNGPYTEITRTVL